MKQKVYKLCVLAFLLFAPFFSKAVTVTDTALAANVQVCLKPELVRLAFSVGGTGTTGSYLDIKLPTGFTWEGLAYGPIVTGGSGSNSITYAGVFAGKHRLTFGSSTALQSIRLGFWQKANCGAGTSSFTTRDSLFFFEGTGSINLSATNAFNGVAPDLSITNIIHTPGTANVGDTVLRKFRVTNGGFGATSNFLIVDNYSAGELFYNISSFVINPSGVNYSLPISQIDIGLDSVILNFSADEISQIGDGDTLFENGEFFDIEYKIIPNSCGNSNVILSNLLATWVCNKTINCKWYDINIGISINIPGNPNLQLIRVLNRTTACHNLTSYGDTGIIRNNGTGPALDINFDLYISGYPHIHRTDMYGYLDTSMVYYKIGQNGARIKPLMTVTGTSAVNNSLCNILGSVTRVSLTIPLLRPGDSLILMTGINVCNYNYTCGAEETHLHQLGLPGINYGLNYKNACRSVTYDGGTQNIIFSYSYPNHQGQNDAPSSVSASTLTNFKQSLLAIPSGSHITNRAYHDITISIPAVLKLDSSYFGAGNYPVNITRANGVVVQPYAQVGPYTFRFSQTSLGGVGGAQSAINIRLKGYCDTNFCAGIVFWGYSWKINPDSVNCSNSNTWVCNNYPIAWTSQCKPVCCLAGLINLEFTTNRINYGKPDNDDNKLPDVTGSIDLSKIRTDKMVSGDTIEYYHKFYIKTNGTHTQWENLYDRFTLPNRASWWDLVSDSVFLNRAIGTDSIFSVTPTSNSNDWITDLSNLTDFLNNDTIIIKMKLVLKVNTSTSFNTQVNGYVSHVPNPVGADRFACVPIIDKMTVWFTQSFLDQVSTQVSNGCQQMSIYSQLYTATGPYGYANINHFEYEYRNFAYPTRVRQIIPKGYVVDSVEVWNISHSGFALPVSYQGLNVPFTIVKDTLDYNVSQYYTPNGGQIVPTDEGGFLQMRHYISPSCKVTPVIAQTLRGQTSYQMNNMFHYTREVVGSNFFNSSTSLQNNQPFFITNSPTPVAPAYQNTISWDISHSNISNVTVPNNWLYLYSKTGNIIVDSVKNGNLLIPKDGNNFYRLGTMTGGQTLNLTIFSSQNACDFDSILASTGYDCKGYPTSLIPKTDTLFYSGQTNLQMVGVLYIPANSVIPANSNFDVQGKVIIGANVSIGSGTIINSSTSIDVLPPNLFWSGIELTIGQVNFCLNNYTYLYIQPQPAAIQTQVTALTTTPSDPSNASSTAYGSSTIYMCQGFPFEMELQATQPGTIYDVKEVLTLPFNGGTGLDYISDSGYIEYPIGTAPRAFSATANTAILSQTPLGSMTLDLAQIDPTNFGSDKGLPGTGLGTNDTRRVKLRWKMKSNCNLVSGEQWQPTQQAISPCSAPATGNNGVTSGFPLDLFGVTRPYVATIRVATGLDGCGEQYTQVRLEKTGATAPQPTDSITIRLPKLVVAGSMVCLGNACPGGTGSTQAYSIRTDALYQYLSFQYPNTAGANGDTLLYQFPMRTINKSICENNQTVKADVYQQLTIYCGAPIPANLCPNAKASLGSETKSFDIRKAILNFNNYYSEYAYQQPIYKYRFLGEVQNSSTSVDALTGVTLKTFMDVNNNLIYDKGTDVEVKTTVLGSSIPAGGSVSFYDSFSNPSFNPSPSVPMYTVIDTGDATANCFCGGVVMSAFNQALPIDFLNAKAVSINNKIAKVSWSINSESGAVKFLIYRKAYGENNFKSIGELKAINNNNVLEYVYLDNISNVPIGEIQYQIEAITAQNETKKSQLMYIVKSEMLLNGQLFNIQPNPANEKVQIQFSKAIEDGQIKVYDMNGKLVLNLELNQNNPIINTSEWLSGIYTVQFETIYGVETHKLSIIK
jgi:hypothetical protein